MQTGDFKLDIKLPNGIWKCDCVEVKIKNGNSNYDVVITPPKDYEVEHLFKEGTPVEFEYNPEMIEYTFAIWPFEQFDYLYALENELSTIVLQKIMSGPKAKIY